ncbi:MAG: NAD-dependent malic enzyme [Chlamydiia bacterium]|nr:NAD-dependent malic enzyme [Chlamydiia bacterium]
MTSSKGNFVITNETDILQNPYLNKGSAFTHEEREVLGLLGRLPQGVSTLEQQVARRYEHIKAYKTPISKYEFLTALKAKNVTLFYRLLLDHAQELIPYLYTPTVGEAAQKFSSHFTNNGGLYLTYDDIDRLDDIFKNYPQKQVDLCLVTDGSRVLGLGDLSPGAMHIAHGKLTLYSLCAGIPPWLTLPIVLDLGTDNEELLNDPFYLGVKQRRLADKAYFNFMDQFVKCLKKYFPKALLQWEDFSKNHAVPVLKRYHETMCSFNDDTQGTAATILAVIISAMKRSGRKLEDEKIVIQGGGAAGTGFAELITRYLRYKKVPLAKIKKNLYIIDIEGVVQEGQKCVSKQTLVYARKKSEISKWKVKSKKKVTLIEVLKNTKATTLIGLSSQPNTFTADCVEILCKNTKHPVIMPLSNPTAKSEADAKDLIEWSNAQAIVATGSPFSPVKFKSKSYHITQCNNFYVFPGMGLASCALKLPHIPDDFFYIAAEILSTLSKSTKDRTKCLLPSLQRVRETSFKIALGVGKEAVKRELIPHLFEKELKHKLSEYVWDPEYRKYTLMK